MKTPAELGYYMPPEWSVQEATWLAWPINELTWPERVQKIQRTYVEVIKHIVTGQNVHLLVRSEKEKSEVRKKLEENKVNVDKVKFFIVPYRDSWLRDTGPNFLLSRDGKRLAINHWQFNAWGNKYVDDEDPLHEDNAIPEEINKLLELLFFEPGIVMEGGAIDTNGSIILTTEQCLLNKNRNPHLSKVEIEIYLKNYYGVKKIIWLKDGIEGDDTDGHVDDICRFVSEDTIVCCVEADKNHPNYAALKENFEILQNSTDASGKKFKVIPLPMPRKVTTDDGTPLPASYANFLITNAVVLMPTFGGENDEKALKILKSCFPNREVVGIQCNDVVWGMGTLHC
ncbi:MAG: agmatine deiminase family protein, partial [Candidatus Micrarchaeota archaeon]|nr:agmatine deiminase family protein [Candidatus Micrarchaeota archaeon]